MSSPSRSNSPGDGPAPRPSLFWRLLPSYLLVIGVGAATTLLAGESFAPFFLEWHVSSMMRTMHNLTTEGMSQGMIVDLDLAYRRALTSSLAWAAVASVAAAALVSLFVTRRIVTPLRIMTRASHHIAGGSYRARLEAHLPGEIGDLADAFNTMAATLERSEEQRVALLADVSHEFRTPLSNLRGYIEGLEDDVFSLDDTTMGACHRQLERLGRLVDDLGLLSQVESGQLELHPRRVTARELLEQSREAFRARFEQKGVRLALVPTSEALSVWADPERLMQVLANLIDNALRHTAAGGIVTLRAVAESVPIVRFEVEDSGSGIDPQDLPHVFERFFRSDRARGRSDGSGSGIGLTLVRQIVERQGGRVGVDSTPGRGSRFWFTLPTFEISAPPDRGPATKNARPERSEPS